MKVECTIKTQKEKNSSSSTIEEIKVESTLLWSHENIKLIVGANEVVINANELINAIKNCTNC
jgi:hypothetical protein